MICRRAATASAKRPMLTHSWCPSLPLCLGNDELGYATLRIDFAVKLQVGTDEPEV